MLGLLPWGPEFCSCRSSLLGLLLLASKGPLFKVFIRSITFSPPFGLGLFGSKSSLSAGHLPSCRDPPPLDGARSLFGVFPPLLVEGLLLVVLDVGNGGNAQSRLAESSGLGGRGSNIRGAGFVALREGAGLDPKPLPDFELRAGDMGDSGRVIGARNGLLAVSGLIRGGAGRGCLGGSLDPRVGALTRVCGGFCSSESNCKGEGVVGLVESRFVVRSAKGFPFELALLPLLDVLAIDVCAEAGAEGGAEGGWPPQVWSPMADISIWSPH